MSARDKGDHAVGRAEEEAAVEGTLDADREGGAGREGVFAVEVGFQR